MRMWDGNNCACSVATRIADCVETFAPILNARKSGHRERYPHIVRHLKAPQKLLAFFEPDKSSIHLAPVPPPRPENYEARS